MNGIHYGVIYVDEAACIDEALYRRMVKLQGGKHKRKASMKHTLTVVACVVGVAVVSVLSITSYNSYEKWAHAQAAKAAAASAQEKQANIAEQAVFNHELAQLKAQCAKDQAAYATLTPLQKKTAVAPTCNTNLVQ